MSVARVSLLTNTVKAHEEGTNIDRTAQGETVVVLGRRMCVQVSPSVPPGQCCTGKRSSSAGLINE